MLDLFISQGGFINTAWNEVSTKVEVTETPVKVEKLVAGDSLWILTSVADWKELASQAAGRGVKVAVLFLKPSLDDMNSALDAGAKCFCPAIANKNVFKAVKIALEQGSIWVPAEFLNELTGKVTRLVGAASKDHNLANFNLTERETEVVKLVLEGKSNAEVGDRLYISERTVKEHMSKVFQKMNVKDRFQLVLKVFN